MESEEKEVLVEPGHLMLPLKTLNDLSRAICLISSGQNNGTGFMAQIKLENAVKIGIFTNWHVLPYGTVQSEEKIFFQFLSSQAHSLNLTITSFYASPEDELDVMFLVLEENDVEQIKKWGIRILDITSHSPQLDEEIIILQYPGRKNLNDGVQSSSGCISLIDVPKGRFFHTADTKHGSSGSPIITKEELVIGIHYAFQTEQHENLASGSMFILADMENSEKWTFWNRKYVSIECLKNTEEGVTKPIPMISELKIYPREAWNAADSKPGMGLLKHPVDTVIVHHTNDQSVFNLQDAFEDMKKIQTKHQKAAEWDDIAYNFVVVETGDVLEGRGWDYVGAHAKGYNDSSIGIAVMGTFIEKTPDDRAIAAMRFLVEEGVRLGKISENYRIIPRCDIQNPAIRLRYSDSPGKMLAEIINYWNDSLHQVIIPENDEG